MEHVRYTEEPDLRRPVLLMAFAGWNDAAGVATTSVRFLVERWEAKKFAEIDPEEFYNFARVRPQVRLDENQNRTIVWPENAFHYHADPILERDFVLLLGIEPNVKWRTFTEAVMGVCQKIGVGSVLALGGLVAQVPHTIAPRVTGTTSDPELAKQFPELAVQRSRYQGPTGIVGVLTSLFTQSGIPVGSLWGNVPHYISASPNPRVAYGLLTRLNTIYGLGIDLSEMERAGRRFLRQVNEAITQNPEVAQYVQQLEANQEAEPEPESPVEEPPGSGSGELPAGEDLVRHLEQFLRQRRTDGNPDEEEEGPAQPQA